MELNDKKSTGPGIEAEIEVRVETVTVIESAGPVRTPDNEIRRSLQAEPSDTPVMYQTWRDLLFLHWEWDAGEIQAMLPPGLFVDTHNGKAYVAVTPFFMSDVRASFLPPIPGTTDFLELNVRTYVHDRNGVPGVWFFSLDCNHGLAVMMAKMFYSLPYHGAEMEAQERLGVVSYRCQRSGAGEASEFQYRREDKPVGAQIGSLPFFLTERYFLYSRSPRSGKLYSARVHHAPWDLFHAQVGKFDARMLQLNKLDPKLRPPDHAWMGSTVRVKIYGLQELAT